MEGDTLDLTFEKPISVASVTYDGLTLGVPTVKHLKAAAKQASGIDAIAKLIELGAKLPASVVDEMNQRDFQRCEHFLDRFAMSSPQSTSPT